MARLTSLAPSARFSVPRWLDERLANAGFRLRLLRLALGRIGDVPAGVMMAIDEPGREIDWLREPDRAMDVQFR